MNRKIDRRRAGMCSNCSAQSIPSQSATSGHNNGERHVDFDDDLRLKMCIDITGEDFDVIHHELGHNFYARAPMTISPLCSATAPTRVFTKRLATPSPLRYPRITWSRSA